MSREQIPITPALVAWARARAGYTVEEAEGDFKQIGAWESGEAYPTYSQLEKLSDKFKVPVAVFFFPEPPDIEPIRNSFRTLPDQQFAMIPRAVSTMLRKAKAMQLNLAELTDGRNPAERLIIADMGFDPDDEPPEMAARVREYLGITIEEQAGWRDADEAFENWRQGLSDAGISVFKDAFKSDDYSGFCLYDDMFPLIYVNNSTTKTRQIFTLFHELAHLLFRTSGVDMFSDEYIAALAGPSRRIETLCNRFAGAFLVPDAEFAQAMAGKDLDEEAIEAAAEHFNVSREVIFRKCLDRGLVTAEEYRERAREWADQREGGAGGGGNYYYTQIAYLGPQYISLALGAYHRNRFDDVKLAEYLNIKPKNVDKFQETFLRRGA